MRSIQIVGVVLVILGIVAVAFAGSWMTGEETTTHMGPLEVKTERTERVHFPRWAGFGAIALGGALILVPLLRGKGRSPKLG